MNDHIKNWMSELEAATKRALANNKVESNTLSIVNISESNGIQYISIGSKIRFAIKHELIYLAPGGNIKKKECYGNIQEWMLWNWEPYYPFKKSLYDWRNIVEKPKKKKSKRPSQKLPMVESLESKTWPYTSNTSEPSRRSRKDSTTLGTERPTRNRQCKKDDRNNI